MCNKMSYNTLNYYMQYPHNSILANLVSALFADFTTKYEFLFNSTNAFVVSAISIGQN